MYLSEKLQDKWAPVLDHAQFGAITSPFKRAIASVLLENQEKEGAFKTPRGDDGAGNGFDRPAVLSETAPSMSVGTGGYTGAANPAGPVAGFDPILVSLVRRSLPNLIAYDVCGVQPMTGPTGLIFAMRSKYTSNVASNVATDTEALYNEANTAYSGNGINTPFDNTTTGNPANGTTFGLANTGYGFPTGIGEDLGGANTWNQMGFSIEKVTVTANTRGLKSDYTLELAQDLKAIHGLDAETELSNILSTEILAEINREVVRTIYATANIGAQFGTTNAGFYNLAISGGDTAGRWQVETYKSLIMQIEREANKIAKDTRRGKGNMLIVSTDIASALAMSGMLDYQSALTNNTNLNVDDTGNTFAGTLFGRLKVYVDPYSVSGADFVVVGFKGATAYDAGLFYCPYVPLQMVRAIDPNTFQPKIGFKTRYGIVANPYAGGTVSQLGVITANSNCYYRKFIVTGLK
jgi:hypothetical protein